jgi:hypothetical protein
MMRILEHCAEDAVILSSRRNSMEKSTKIHIATASVGNQQLTIVTDAVGAPQLL